MGNQMSANAGGNASEDEIMQMQMRREAAIISQDMTCKVKLDRGVAEQNDEELIDSIDQFLVKKRLDGDFYDPGFMEALSCSMRVGLTVDNQLTASNLVKEFFTDQKQIGGISVEGVAMLSGIQGNKSSFVIKAPRNPQKDNLVHEYFIAVGGVVKDFNGNERIVIGTNWLRKVCLNYALVLGAFRCSPPDIDPLSKKVRSWCNNEIRSSFVSYVIYEKIDGPDMAALAKTIDAETFVTSMIQLAYALEIGQVYNGFTHYDLHHENTIMRDMGTEMQIPFVLSEDVTVYIVSRYIVSIIDYGRCHIQSPAPAAEYMGEEAVHFGYHANFALQYGINAYKSRPYYDLYKYLGFTLYTMLENNNPAFERVWPILGFFGIQSRDTAVQWLIRGRQGDNLFSAIDELEKVGFCLSKVGQEGTCAPESATTMFDFLAYVEQQFPIIWKTKVLGYPVDGMKVLQCGVECDKFDEALRDMTEDTRNKNISNLSTFSDFRDLIRYRNNLHRRGLYFRERFPESDYGTKLVSDVEKLDKIIIDDYPETKSMIEQIILEKGKDVALKYDMIGYPLQYTENPSTNPEVVAQELIRIGEYLDRMGEFAKSYYEFKEFYEAGEDLSRIAGDEWSQELQNYLETEISPKYQRFDNSRGQFRRILELTPVPQQFNNYKQDLLLKTM